MKLCCGLYYERSCFLGNILVLYYVADSKFVDFDCVKLNILPTFISIYRHLLKLLFLCKFNG